MIRAVLRLLVRSLVDLGLVCALLAGLLLFTSYRILRRLATDDPSELERHASTLLAALGTAAALAARYARAGAETDT